MKKGLYSFFLLFLLLTKSFAQHIPIKDLIVYYPFKGNANDSMGNYHMSVFGATLASDRYLRPNHSYHFDGVDDVIMYTDTLPSTADFTWSFWIRIDTLQNAALIFNGNTNSNGFGFAINNGTNSSQGMIGKNLTLLHGGIGYSNSLPEQVNVWSHVILRRESGEFKIYINNVLKDSTSISSLTPFGKFHLGLDYTDGSNAFKGNIDDIAIYNRALTEAEIDTLFHGCGQQIMVSPTNTTVLSGLNATFTVTHITNSQITYQWQMDAGTGFMNLSNAGPFSGVNTDTLRITNVSAQLHNNNFRVIITNDIGCKDTSATAKLIVAPNAISNIEIDSAVLVIPNPSYGKFRIYAPHLSANNAYTVIVSNYIGQIILKKSLLGSDLKHLTLQLQLPGSYLLTITDKNNECIIRKKVLIN